MNIVSANGLGTAIGARLLGTTIGPTPVEGANNYADALQLHGPGIVGASLAACNLMQSKELMEKFRVLFHLAPVQPKIQLTTLWNGKEWGGFLETWTSSHFMSNEVGPNVGIALLNGVVVKEGEVGVAVPNLREFERGLQFLEYTGEVTIWLDDQYNICHFRLGHIPAHLAAYAQVVRGGLESCFKFIFQRTSGVEMYNASVVAVLVSNPPFPYLGAPNSLAIPEAVEKYLWKIQLGPNEVAYAVAHGYNQKDLRSRLYRTLYSLQKERREVQFRTDFISNRAHFSFSDQEWREGWKEKASGKGVSSTGGGGGGG